MKFFSDPSLHIDDDLLKKGYYNVAGSGRGTLRALDEVFTCKDRVDLLQLFYPYVEDEVSAKLLHVKKKGVEIEVYVNEKMKTEKDIFLPYATIYTIKED